VKLVLKEKREPREKLVYKEKPVQKVCRVAQEYKALLD
jgi:hypothetical protein